MDGSLMIVSLGLAAASLTSLSYLPQARKAIPRGATKDLSLKTLGALLAGLFLWVVYGILRSDMVIVIANSVGAVLVAIVMTCKLRDLSYYRRSGDDRFAEDGLSGHRRESRRSDGSGLSRALFEVWHGCRARPQQSLSHS